MEEKEKSVYELEEKDNDLEQVKSNALNLLSDSNKFLDYYSYSILLSAKIAENLDTLLTIKDENLLKIEISKLWSSIKRDKNLKIPKPVDNSIIDSVKETLGGELKMTEEIKLEIKLEIIGKDKEHLKQLIKFLDDNNYRYYKLEIEKD